MLPIRGLYEIAIPVSDLPRAEAFYREVLGLEIGLRDEKRNWLFLRAGGEAGMVVLQEKKGEWPTLHFAFTVEEDDIEKAAMMLKERGVETDGPYYHEWMPATSVYFSDPDGHQLELCATVSKKLLQENSLRMSPHLCFDGQCEDAFRMYQRILGGRITTMLSYGDSPMAEQVPAHWRNRIVHATLNLGDHELLGADLFPGDYERPEGFFVTLHISDLARAGQIFEALSQSGIVKMPFQPTFWSPGFGVLVDRYGIPWEINCEQSKDSAWRSA